MNAFEIQSEIDGITMELRSLIDSVKDTNNEVNIEEVRSKKTMLEEKRAKLMKELAETNRPEERAVNKDTSLEARTWIDAAAEKRSITIGSAGAINQVKKLFKDVADNDNILAKASYFYGANANTMIPVLAPLDDPADYDEGATNVAVDEGAGVAVTSILPRAYAKVLPITAEALSMGIVDLEAELPAIFEKAFNKVMHKEMLQGSSTGMKGIFTSAVDGTNVATGATISNLAKLALTVVSKDEEYSIVLNPSVYQTLLSDASAGEDVKLYKEGLIRDKTIEGVKVILDNQAPVSAVSGAVLAVAVPLSRYCIGIAGDIKIDPIKVKGDTNTYFQATMFFNGMQLKANDLYTIVKEA